MLNRNIIGKEYPSYSYEVEKGKIREFARAIGEKNQIYYDEGIAGKKGYEGLVAPPTFGTVFFVAGNLMYDIITDLQGDLVRMLQVAQEYEYFKPIHPGMIITAETKVTDIFTKESKAGSMDFVIVETDYSQQSGEKVMVEKLTVVFRN